MKGMGRRHALAGSVLLASVGAKSARAAAWPTRPVTIIVPYGPGASNDMFARVLADGLSRRSGQAFIVDNRPGAGGVTGITVVSRSTPDGYTLVEMPNGIVGLTPVLHVKADPLKDLTPIAIFARSPTALVVPAALPVKTVAEFIAYAKANPGKVFYGYAGIGTTQQQHMEMFNQLTATRIKGVNYKSSGDAQTDLLAGRLQAMFVTVASTLGEIRSGQLRLLGYTTSNDQPDAPRAPTLAEAGVPGMEKAQIWWGMFGPPAMPAELVQTINTALNAVIADPGFAAMLAKSGATPVRRTPQQFVATIKDGSDLFAEFLKTMPRD
jgi:tripartite-type tricarboxylate transporter receptor subunit TctC